MSRAELKRAGLSAELNTFLEPHEKIIMFGGCIARVDRLGATVVRRGTLFVSNQRFGVLTKKIGSHDLVSIPLALVTNVELDRNVTAAQMTVAGAGLTLHMERMQVSGAKEFAKVLREQMALSKVRVEKVSETSVSPVSFVDEIKKLSDLQSRGILTSEEFALAKARLLDGH
jgi:hypothetical protein